MCNLIVLDQMEEIGPVQIVWNSNRNLISNFINALPTDFGYELIVVLKIATAVWFWS